MLDLKLPSDLAQGDLVPRDLVKDLRLASAVGEKIDEVEHERAHAFGSDRGAKMPLEVVRVGGGRDLLIANRSLAAQLLDGRPSRIDIAYHGGARELPSEPLRAAAARRSSPSK